MQTNKLNDGSTEYRLPTGQSFTIAIGPAPESNQAVYHHFVAGTIDALANTATEWAKTETNADLSPVGREKALAPLRSGLVEQIARAWSNIGVLEAGVDKREAALLAVPTIDPTNSVAAIEAREIRDWWASQPLQDRAKLLDRMNNEPGHEQIMLALMRSPIKQLDHEVDSVRQTWIRQQRMKLPHEAMAIDGERAAIDWSRRALATVAGNALTVAGIDRKKAMRVMLEADIKGHAAFGFTDYDAQVAEAQFKGDPTFRAGRK